MSVAKDPSLASATVERTVDVVRPGDVATRTDRIVVEEPLEIRAWGPRGAASASGTGTATATPVAVAMRTPGADVDLAAGFLLGEGVVRTREDIRAIAPDGIAAVLVELSADAEARLDRTARRFTMTSSCGVCGKASIDAVRAELPPPRASAENDASTTRLGVETVLALGDALRRAQHAFEHTGSLHAAGLFTDGGELLRFAEDVGRHNAVDKVLGAELLAGRVPCAPGSVLFLSGRIAFELVQKAALAGVEVVAGIGGPTSLAVELADAAGITLIGFAREGRFNVYSGRARVVGLGSRPE